MVSPFISCFREKRSVIGISLTIAIALGQVGAGGLAILNQDRDPRPLRPLSIALDRWRDRPLAELPNRLPVLSSTTTPAWLVERARQITVKVRVGENNGSGILVRRRGSVYTVLTNRHVVNAGTPYGIQTPDGRSHPGHLVKTSRFREVDLAILEFRSTQPYTIASLGSAQGLKKGDAVLAAGFPLDVPPTPAYGLWITTGAISLLPHKALQGGYQIGYTNPIRKGMSGGPVLNRRGVVVGINSLHAYPLWGDPYIYQDGSKPPTAQRPTIVQSSWAVPIDQFHAFSSSIRSAL